VLRWHKLRQFCRLRAVDPAAYPAAMTRFMHRYLTLFLILAISLTAHSAGATLGMRDATGQMVICSGSGPVVIYVDSDGQPARAPHDCPDCIAMGQEALVLPQPSPLPAPTPLRVATARDDIRTHSRMPLRATARAPPLGF